MYAVTLIAVVAAVIGSVTAIAFHEYMYGKLDGQLHDISRMAESRPPGSGKITPGVPEKREPLDFVGMGGGQPFNTFGAVVTDGSLTGSKVVKRAGSPGAQQTTEALTGAQTAVLDAAGVTAGGEPRDVELPGLGGYRVEAVPYGGTTTVLVGIPTAEVDKAVNTLIIVEVCVTGAGLIAAGIAGAAMVGMALRPLRRVAATATRVSELPCTAERWLCSNGFRRRRRIRVPRSARSVPPSTGCWVTSVRPWTPVRRARHGCASSSRTPATSCVRRSPRSAVTPN